MARRKKQSKRRGRGHSSAGQKLLLAVSGVVLILCASSMAYSFFFRPGGRGAGGAFRIEVLNGTGQSGLANAARRTLLRKGMDVVRSANAPRFDYAETVLIARRADADVEELGRLLGCRHVIVQVRENSVEDASLILGADYRDLNLDWGLDADLRK